MRTYSLGERVVFTRHLTRRYAPADPGTRWSRKVWEPEAYPGHPEPKERQGIVVGERTLANGKMEGGYGAGWDYDPVRFRATEHFKAYLVAYDLRRKPVLVLPEHMRRTIELLLMKPCDSAEEHPPHKYPGKHWCNGIGIWA